LTQPWRKRTVSDTGFTLLEVLVALVLLVILSAALYGTYFSLIRGRDLAVEKMDERRELSATLDLLHRELTAALYNSQNKKLHFVVEDRDYFGKPASTLEFTAIVSPRSDSIPASDQVDVVYTPREKDKKLILMRQEKDLYVTSAPFPYPQMMDLDGFLVECYDGGKWVRTWDTALNYRLPSYIRVTIGVRDGEKTLNFSTIARPRIGS
jgi:general secretion pathway protein J